MSAAWQPDLGANVVDGGVHFRVWAPNARRVEVAIERPRGTERHDVYADEPHTDKVVVGVRGEVAEFCSAIQERRPPRPPVEESTRALQVVLAAYNSMTSGGVVRIP